ncbi:helix-turn-helix transcriptional regulator [Tellurirhabdus bombi]|uniref:helix-turn-helix transcriptional regulator n=1 Tax=Tellurirhabdus bombi TaxID=2907205 RepID=UPI001F1C224D|nr:WYL domain-containing protein [Tellurirhabdus bombi]
MPLIKNQFERLKKINERLNRWNRGVVSKTELLQLCDCSESTLKTDLEYLRDVYEAPIKYDRRQKGWRYERPFDMAASVTLSSHDLAALETAAATLSQLQHLDIFRDLRGTVDKIDKAVRFRASKRRKYQSHILFESVPYVKGNEYIEPLLRAIHEEQAVTFQYQKYESEEIKDHVVYPYILKEHRNRWYLIGWQGQKGYLGLRTYGLDRILPNSLQAASPLSAVPEFDAETYFRYSLGVAVYEKNAPEDVVLSFTPKAGKQFKAQPFYPFNPEDVLLDSADECRIRLYIIINLELVYELARLGAGVKVLSPNSLVELVKGHHQQALDVYQEEKLEK